MQFINHFTIMSNTVGGGSSRGRKKRGEDVIHSLKVSLEDLYNGTTKKLSLSRNVLCSRCKGYALCLILIVHLSLFLSTCGGVDDDGY